MSIAVLYRAISIFTSRLKGQKLSGMGWEHQDIEVTTDQIKLTTTHSPCMQERGGAKDKLKGSEVPAIVLSYYL